MELRKIEHLLDKYFEGETTLEDEKALRDYFNSPDPDPKYEDYKPLFTYYERESKLEPMISRKQNAKSSTWMSVAASVVVVIGVGIYAYQNQPQEDLGTFDDPEVALQQTQRALELLSENVNVGMQSVEYVSEYKESRDIIFK